MFCKLLPLFLQICYNSCFCSLWHWTCRQHGFRLLRACGWLLWMMNWRASVSLRHCLCPWLNFFSLQLLLTTPPYSWFLTPFLFQRCSFEMSALTGRCGHFYLVLSSLLLTTQYTWSFSVGLSLCSWSSLVSTTYTGHCCQCPLSSICCPLVFSTVCCPLSGPLSAIRCPQSAVHSPVCCPLSTVQSNVHSPLSTVCCP